MRLPLVLPLLVLAVTVLLAYAPVPPSAGYAPAVADTTRHENLQVFPADIPHEQLMGAMRSFTRALGVRCDHCHARAEDGEMDFPSDANPHKDIAREMMRMNRQLNMELLASIEGLAPADGFRVTCWTCHRGEATPATIWPQEDEEAGPPQPDGRDGAPPHPQGDPDHGDHDHGDHDHGDHDHGDHDHEGEDGDGGR